MPDTPWLWNKGIVALCDHRLPEDFPDGHYHYHENSNTRSQRDYYRKLAIKINHGDLLWIKADWLDFFVRTILPRVNVDFVLVTADTDLSIPSSMPEQAAILMNCPQVLHWYTQNYDGTVESGFVSPLPIGMDFHTIQRRAFWGMPQMSVVDQQLKLEEIRGSLNNTFKRIPRVYADAAIRPRVDPIRMGSSNALTRLMLMCLLEGNPLVYEQDKFLPQHDM